MERGHAINEPRRIKPAKEKTLERPRCLFGTRDRRSLGPEIDNAPRDMKHARTTRFCAAALALQLAHLALCP
ncbi:hypothetical protein F4860DRAFT_511088 [Xylaria cubensis]|nr:hypothetical protein F4860DRAFT_511088 [Xylaria cubensis]